MNEVLDMAEVSIRRPDPNGPRWRVLIANAWGGNRGDEAMLNTLNRLLREVCAQVEVDVMPYRNEALDIDPQMTVRRNTIGEYWYAPVPEVLSGALRARIPRGAVKVLSTALHRMGLLARRSLVRSYDLVISAPQGPTLGDMYGAKERIVEPLRIAQACNKPYMILAISAGPFKADSPAQKLVGDVLAGAQRVVLREEVSLGHVAARYPQLGNLEAAIDIVYALPWSLRDKAPGQLSAYREFMAGVGDGALGACISLTPARDPSNDFDRGAYVDKFVALVDHVLERSGEKLVLFPHLAFDMPALEQIRSRSRFTDQIFILPPELDSDFQRDAISRLGFFVSSRYHPTIFAVQAKVPFLCIKNQFKVEGMLDKIGLGEVPCCWQDEPLESFVSAYDACWERRTELRDAVAAGADRAARLASRYQALLAEQFATLQSARAAEVAAA